MHRIVRGIFNCRDIWTGTAPRVLFVCPRITSHPYYYGRIYKNFKRDFGDLPYLIAGAQPKPVDDDHVVGLLDNVQYEALYRKSRGMYDHSREPRHLRYHPVEAMIYGMPVIHMKGGLLKAFGDPDGPRFSVETEANDLQQRAFELLKCTQYDEGPV
ncbi:MAG: hypothetical protein NTU53_10715 [Planctomycetota bacterium]|nr:hypothetical protein [Planctomycetota bacterium]